MQQSVFSKGIGKILSLGYILCASKDLVLYVSITDINVYVLELCDSST